MNSKQGKLQVGLYLAGLNKPGCWVYTYMGRGRGLILAEVNGISALSEKLAHRHKQVQDQCFHLRSYKYM